MQLGQEGLLGKNFTRPRNFANGEGVRGIPFTNLPVQEKPPNTIKCQSN